MPVLYYGREVDPARFHGWRGRLVRAIAWLIARLERWAEWHLMHLLAENAGLPQGKVRVLEEVFKAEDAKATVRDLLHAATTPTRDERYHERKGAPEGVTSHRPSRADTTRSMFSVYASGRPARYARKRSSRLADPNGDAEDTRSTDEDRREEEARATHQGEPQDGYRKAAAPVLRQADSRQSEGVADKEGR